VRPGLLLPARLEPPDALRRGALWRGAQQHRGVMRRALSRGLFMPARYGRPQTLRTRNPLRRRHDGRRDNLPRWPLLQQRDGAAALHRGLLLPTGRFQCDKASVPAGATLERGRGCVLDVCAGHVLPRLDAAAAVRARLVSAGWVGERVPPVPHRAVV
jgi:hypothetical protein